MTVLCGRAAEARVFAEKAVVANPNWNVGHFVLGTHQAREGQFLDAIRSANRALRLDPLAPGTETVAIAYLNYRLGRTDEALEMWERARTSGPGILARIGLAGVYQSRGRHADARAEVQDILRVNPDLTAELAVEIPLLQAMLDAKRRGELRDQLRLAGLP